jgi:hypothetical protein
MLVYFRSMNLVKPTSSKSAGFLILILSIILVVGISNNYLNSSAEGSQFLTNAVPKVIGIQDEGIEMPSPNELGNTTEGSSDLPDVTNQGNETTGGVTDGLSSGESLSGDANQTEGSVTLNEESDLGTNQTGQTEDQVTNQNVNQTTNQNLNVNQTTNQNVNIQSKQRLELIISEEEGEAPISVEEQTRIESQDNTVVTQHTRITNPECRTGNVLAGASNAEDLRVLLECQDATGTVMHTKMMDDGDYKFFLNLDEQFKFLVNEKNIEKTEGFLVVEIVPPDQQLPGLYLPKDGDRVHVLGAWVTDKPKGWHEIHPAWQVVKQ